MSTIREHVKGIITGKDAIIERLQAERDRLRELFKKYIIHVYTEEGSTFMPSEYDDFSAEEVATLETLDAEAAAMLAKEGQ